MPRGGRHLRHDGDVLEPPGEEHEARRAGGVGAHLLVAVHAAVELAEEEVGPAIAVEVGEVGDVLPLGEDRRAVHVEQGVGGHGEAPAPGVPPVADAAVLRLAEEVGQAVAVEVGEAVPLAGLEPLVAVGAPLEPGRPGGAGVLEQRELVGALLQEEVEVAVAVDVHQLGARHVEAAEEGRVVRGAGLVQHRERGEDAAPGRLRGGGRWGRRGEEGRGGQGKPAHRAAQRRPAAPTPVGEGPTSMVSSTCPVARSMTATHPFCPAGPVPCCSCSFGGGPSFRLAT